MAHPASVYCDRAGAINGIIQLFNQLRGQKVVSLNLRTVTKFVFYLWYKI